MRNGTKLTLALCLLVLVASAGCTAPTAPAKQPAPAKPAFPAAAPAQAQAPAVPPRGKVVELNWSMEKRTLEVTHEVHREVWTFNGQVPGPTVRVNQGDTVRVTLTNKDPGMAHSIDFHAARISPQRGFKDVAPNETFTFVFVANDPGVFVYHCGTSPHLMHIANGMYGAIIVDPAKGRAPAREFVLVQGEWYKDPNSLTDMKDGLPVAVAFNGQAHQYVEKPLEAKVGELVRLYVANPGPNHFSAFHVVGTIFDLVQPSGNPESTLKGIQTWTVAPGDAALFEMVLPEEGGYPAVSHSFADATRGAMAIIKATR